MIITEWKPLVTEPCKRHPDRPGGWAVALHYVDTDHWRDIIRPEQVLDVICAECRIELIRWLSEVHRAG